MNRHNGKAFHRHTWVAVQSGVTMFLLLAFTITCSFTIFFRSMTQSIGLTLTEENIRKAAIMTFANVILLTLLFTAADYIRRKITVERPVRHIIEAADRIMKGDFSARIPTFKSFGSVAGYDIIIDYFNKMATELSGVETLRTDFIANVSHELKTPLSVIHNYGTMLQQPHLADEQRMEYAKSITESCRKMADLISNILKLNKLENQQIYPNQQIYNLGEQLCECLLAFENIWEEKEIEINTDIEEEVFVEADAELLSLVWNNLFSNALKFTDPGGSVSLALKTDDRYATVEVSDMGCGISPEAGAHIFEKFYQGDTSHATQGNGLGLALVKRVVDIVSGNIDVSSVIGEGSTFTVRIRRKQDG